MSSNESESMVRCGNCGEPLNEPTALPEAERKPCPRCGSLSRSVLVSVHEFVSAHDVVTVVRVGTAEEREQALGAVPVKTPRVLQGMWDALHERPGDVLRVLRFTEVGDQLLAEVLNASGEVIGSGIGSDYDDAILELAEHLQPHGQS